MNSIGEESRRANNRDVYLRAKRILDLSLGLTLLVPSAPLLIGLCALIWVNGGSPIFKQQRVGLKRRPFYIYKFRTMIVNADRLLGTAAASNRVTRIGSLLRRSSLDELPQLFNIIMGQMSFIGPRPMLADMAERVPASKELRFEMRPGVTGLAQVSGRNRIPWSRRIEYDCEYVRLANLYLDGKIFALTVVSFVSGRDIVIDRNSEEMDDLR